MVLDCSPRLPRSADGVTANSLSDTFPAQRAESGQTTPTYGKSLKATTLSSQQTLDFI